MELRTLKKPDLVVALDIGSTYSGYAWQWRGDFEKNRSNIEFNTEWGLGSMQLHKTSTCLLLDKDKNVDSFGGLAESRFCNECDSSPNDIQEKWYFFKRFKLLLYRNGVSRKTLIDDYVGQLMPLFYVMTKFIGALKDHFMNNLKEKGQEVNLDKTLFVVTVPAIWSDAAKKFMRDAAEESGINKKNLLLALEPEAAALYCIHLPSEQKMAMNNVGEKGDKFLTVDLGGGTADISAIEVLEDGMLKEMCSGAGNLVGGQDINNAFFQACKDVFDGNAWHDIFNERNAEELLTMEDDFEKKKVAIGSDEPRDEDIRLSIPHSMVGMLNKGTIKLKDAPEVGKQFKIDRGKFMFNSAYIRETLFQETVNRILHSINEVLDKADVKGIKTVVLVGGFAESPIVVEKIKIMIKDKHPNIKVVVPTSPFRAVLKGAVLFGHDPLIFRSRVSRATYGIKTNESFDSVKHDTTKKWTDASGIELCKQIFDIHVRKDQSVILNDKQTARIYEPIDKEQTKVTLPIYTSKIQEPKYTTDEGCTELASITVEMPDTTGGCSRKVKVNMIYGGTELSVIAIDETTGKEFTADISFDRV